MSNEHIAGEILSDTHPHRAPDDYDQDLPTPVVTDPVPYSNTRTNEAMDAEAQAFAENYAASANQRWEGQERWMGKENEEMRLVNILTPHAVIRALQAAGIKASLEPAVHETWRPNLAGILVRSVVNISGARLWLHTNIILDRVGISAWVDGEPKYITFLQWPKGPEWSLMRFNDYDVPTSERYRGWRTALLRLMQEHVISEDEVNKAFGPVIENEASLYYRQQVAELRNRRRL